MIFWKYHCIRIVESCHRMYCSKVLNEDVRRMRSKLFDLEKQRQLSLITRVEKIEVSYKGVPKDCTLIMNKNLSTPYNCAMHTHDFVCQQSVIAEVNGNLWDMHRPLTEDCELRFLNFISAPDILNKIFWRSCSFLLGLVIDKAFRDDYFVQLHSWPKPNVKSGSYVYDVDLKISNWKPTSSELRALTVMLWKIGATDHCFERLDVSESLALEMFQHNQFKKQQVPEIAAQNQDRNVTLYRVDDHVDISFGPMIGSTKFLGTTQVTAVHQLDSDTGYRFQALSIPKQLPLNSFAFNILAERAKKLNLTGLQGNFKDQEADYA